VQIDDIIFGLSNQGAEPDVVRVQDILNKDIGKKANSTLSISDVMVPRKFRDHREFDIAQISDSIKKYIKKELNSSLTIESSVSKDVSTKHTDEILIDEFVFEASITSPEVSKINIGDSVSFKIKKGNIELTIKDSEYGLSINDDISIEESIVPNRIFTDNVSISYNVVLKRNEDEVLTIPAD